VSDARSEPSFNVFDEIRAACRAVAERARFVRIDRGRISEVAQLLALDGAPRPLYDRTHHFLGEEAATVSYVLALDTVNFGSGYFPHLRKRPGMSGYHTIASALADRYRAVGPLDADSLATITPAACARLFGQEDFGEPIDELMDLVARAWNDLGRDLIDRFGGTCTGLVDAADRSAARLVALLSAQPFFRDVARHDGRDVPLFKRAQIAASDLALAFDGAGPGRFDDLDRLTIFADNLVPHVLRCDGVLHYDPKLLARIDRGERIPAGSPEEVEIRACAVDAVERIAASLRATGTAVTARDLDVLLWTRGQNPEYKRFPRHRTRTVFY